MISSRESSREAPYVAACVPTGNFFIVLRARYFPHLLYLSISFALSFMSNCYGLDPSSSYLLVIDPCQQ